MKTIEYRTVDKSGWTDGPWQDEPDKLQWQDEATGLPCLIVRGPLGALCGYVGVAEGHPWFSIEYNKPADGSDRSDYTGENWLKAPESIISVHGGLTFSDACRPGDEAEGICHKPDAGEPEHVWWFGFDCAHYRDLIPSPRMHGSWTEDEYRDLAYVRDECTSLARQLAAVGSAP